MKALALQTAHRGYILRMSSYLREMYPLPVRFATAVLLYLSITAILTRAYDLPLKLLSSYSLLGIVNVFLLGLILRLMDELKDRDIDCRLFAHRPLPSGRVRESDIRGTLTAICLGYLVLNLASGPAFWTSVLVLGYALLMNRYFFVPRVLERYLLLNLASHNPIVALMLLNGIALFVVGHDLPLTTLISGVMAALIGLYWALLFSWEIARKIRASNEEDEYVTYSRLLGRWGAVALAGGVQTATFAAGFYCCLKLASVWPFLIVAGAGYINLMCEYFRFLLGRNPTGFALRRYTEAYLASFWFAMLLTMVVWPQ